MNKLYRCTVITHLVVSAKDEYEAEEIARKNAREENTIDNVLVEYEITKEKEVPSGWMCSYPYVQNGVANDYTVEELISASAVQVPPLRG